jgi:hypothetical protein
MILHVRARDALFVLLFTLVAPGRAAPASATPDGSGSPVTTGVAAPAPASAIKPAVPERRLKLSPLLARQVSAALPVWSPPLAKPPKKLLPPDPKVVEMDPVLVWGSRVKLTETDVLTDTAKLEMAEKKYISPLYRVTFGPLSQLAGYYFNFLTILNGWHPNEAEARTLYLEDDRLQMLDEMDSLVRLERLGGDSKDAKELQRIRFEASALSR